MIERNKDVKKLVSLLKRYRVVGIIGARQVGKTTLARTVRGQIGGASFYFDLENPEDLARLADPMFTLKGLKGLVVIDEIQRLPELFPILRVLADRPKAAARFLVLGSASPELLRQGSESLAGRIVYHELGGFSLEEVGIKNHQRLWLRGGIPRSYLASSDAISEEWRLGFIRDLPRKRPPTIGDYYPFNYSASLLEHAFALSRPGVELLRVRAVFRSSGHNCSQLS